jgi:hypothetical protein
MTLSQHQRSFVLDLAELIQYAYRNNMEFTLGEAYRTEDQQAIYVRQRLSRTMDSYHRKRLAVDLNLFIGNEYQKSAAPYRPLGDFWKSLNTLNHWGGDFAGLGDGNHFERRPQ